MAPRKTARTLAGVLILLAAVPLASNAWAYPGEDDVQKAKQQVAAKAASVEEMQKQLDAAQSRMDAADTALGVAAENYDEAQIALTAATQKAQAAQTAAKIAAQRLATARVEVGRLAASAYRDGGVSTLDVVLSASGPQDVLDRANALQGVGQRQQSVLRTVDASRAASDALAADAAKALLEQQAAADAVEKAKEAAEAQSAAAHDTYASAQATQTQLTAELAAARRTSVAVEQARQAGLAEEKRKREEAAALERSRRAAAERAKSEAPSSSTGSNGSSGSSSSGGSGSSDDGGDDQPSGGGSSSGSAGGGSQAVAWARTKVGLPYLWGGDGPGSYDCSGLTMKAWAQAGVSLPHSSRLQYTTTEHVSYDDLRPGDLIFYATNPSSPSTIHHVTLYAGGGMMVEAPRTGLDVRVVPVRWGDTMPFAGRP